MLSLILLIHLKIRVEFGGRSVWESFSLHVFFKESRYATT